MDTNELISHSRARFDHHQAKIVLREKYQAKMTFAYGGGMWRRWRTRAQESLEPYLFGP